MNNPMPMIQRIMSRRFSERRGKYDYCWLPDCILYPKLNYITRFRGPRNGGVRSHYLEFPTM